MIFNEIFSTYFGWCPRYDENLMKSTPSPIPNLSTMGKAVIAILLGSWGLFSILIYTGNLLLSEALQYGFYRPDIAVLFIQTILSIFSGIAVIVLLIDYSISKEVLGRHRLELFGLLASQALLWFVTPFHLLLSSTYMSGIGIGQLELLIYSDFATFISEALLFGYLAYRVLSKKTIFGRNMFLLAFLMFAAPFAIGAHYMYYYSTRVDLLGLVNTGLQVLGEGVAAIFCLSVYAKLRRKPSFELTLPSYVRAMVFIEGFVCSGLLYFLVTWDAKYLLLINGNVGGLAYSAYFFFFLGLMAASFLQLRFRVGEDIQTIPETRA
jgi:hypothetical protein